MGQRDCTITGARTAAALDEGTLCRQRSTPTGPAGSKPVLAKAAPPPRPLRKVGEEFPAELRPMREAYERELAEYIGRHRHTLTKWLAAENGTASNFIGGASWVLAGVAALMGLGRVHHACHAPQPTHRRGRGTELQIMELVRECGLIMAMVANVSRAIECIRAAAEQLSKLDRSACVGRYFADQIVAQARFSRPPLGLPPALSCCFLDDFACGKTNARRCRFSQYGSH